MAADPSPICVRRVRHGVSWAASSTAPPTLSKDTWIGPIQRSSSPHLMPGSLRVAPGGSRQDPDPVGWILDVLGLRLAIDATYLLGDGGSGPCRAPPDRGFRAQRANSEGRFR